jgi:hypothetical protein
MVSYLLREFPHQFPEQFTNTFIQSGTARVSSGIVAIILPVGTHNI